jgi:sugar-phosphatase
MVGTHAIGTFQAALFDMDGTLIDSAASGERAWRTLADRWQLARPDRALFQIVHGMPARQALRRIVPAALVEAASRELKEIEAEDTAGVAALPGAVELLLALPEVRKAIVTSSFREVTVARLAAAGIAPPRNLVTSEVVARGKPDPDPFLTAAALLGFPAEQTIAFEDTRPGIRSAKAAGCAVVAVEGLHRRSELGEADHVVGALTEVRVQTGPDGLHFYVE